MIRCTVLRIDPFPGRSALYNLRYPSVLYAVAGVALNGAQGNPAGVVAGWLSVVRLEGDKREHSDL